MKIKDFLRRRRAPFTVYPHDEVFDAQRTAHSLRVPGHNVAKTVLLRLDGGFKYAVAVVPATERLDLKRISKALGDARVELATEHEIAERCPECECGVVPPVGVPFGVQVIVDASLGKHYDLFFPGDTHQEAIRMKYSDFYGLEHPLVIDMIERGGMAAVAV
jgi:Ala-tRNA(Pro) deacylase